MSRERTRFRNYLEYGSFLAARRVVTMLGPRALLWLGTGLGDLFWLLGIARRRVMQFNLELAMPQLDRATRQRLSREVARHFGRVSLDAIRLQRVGPDELLAAVDLRGQANLAEALDAGKGVFLLSAHIGSWEVAALVAGLIIPEGFSVVNRPLDNPLLEMELARIRERFGNRALGKAGVTREMLRQLRRGGAVGILIDQRAQERDGVQVPFFGQPAWTHAILARMALRTGAPVVPIWGFPDGPGRYIVELGAPIHAASLPEGEQTELALTSRLVGVIEQVVREHPEQWLWYHDRWRDLRRSPT